MIITDIDELTERQLRWISRAYKGNVHLVPDLALGECNWAEAQICITYGGSINKEFLDKCPNLKWIQVFQSGVESIPVDELARRGIILTNMLGVHGIPMTEYVLGSILYFSRNFPKYLENQRQHIWDRKELVGEAYSKVVGIFGAGTVGRSIAQALNVLGMTLFGMNTSGTMQPHFHKMYTMDQKMEMLQQCDFVILLLPLTDQTNHFMGELEFKVMKKEAYLINIGRGRLLDEEAFIQAITNNEIKGAALDVFQEEPLPQNSPLWDLNNVVLTPHMAAKSVKYLDRCIAQFIKNLDHFSSGITIHNQVNLSRGY